MGAVRTPLIAGNWKMNLDHLQAIALVQKLSWALGDVKHDFADVEVAVFPPFTDLRSVQTLIAADKLALKLGAQDVSAHTSGAYTGEISSDFLARLDVNYVLVGHSERRQYHAETDAVVGAKAKQAAASGLVPVICVGENQSDLDEFGPAKVACDQLAAVLDVFGSKHDFVVAYEPVWAIGTGNAASPSDAQGVILELRRVISSAVGEESANATRILYGGSVKSENVASFMRESDIDGVLVGGASIDVNEFARIVQYKKHVGR